MGKPKLFVITLSENNLVYFAGSNVKGSVSLELSKPKKYQGISIVFSGKVYVHWGQQRGLGTVNYSDTQIIFKNKFIQLWGNDMESQELAAGRYEFPFKFHLPSNLVLPTSYESHTGYIRYSLFARISRSWKFDHTTTRAITVNEIVDINTAQLIAPLSSSNEKALFCCISGPISLSVKTDRGGYCPGESIAISTEAENHSNRRITSVRATLKQIVVYYARGHSHVHNKIIRRIEGPGIEPGATSNWSNKLRRIPATVPSISSCRILKLSYVVTVTLVIPHALDLHVVIPVTIGNVPFRGGQSTAVDCPVPSAPTAPYTPPAATDPYPPVGPPGGSFNYSTTYPAVNIGLDNYTMGETKYAPVSDYQFAPPPSYAEATVKVKGGEN